MSKNNDCLTGNLLNYSYHKNYYKVIGVDLLRQTNTSIPQKMNFAGKLEEDNEANLKSSKKLCLAFL